MFLTTHHCGSITHRFQFWRTNVRPVHHVDAHNLSDRDNRQLLGKQNSESKTKLWKERRERRRGFFSLSQKWLWVNVGYWNVVAPFFTCLTLRFVDRGWLWPSLKISVGNTALPSSLQLRAAWGLLAEPTLSNIPFTRFLNQPWLSLLILTRVYLFILSDPRTCALWNVPLWRGYHTNEKKKKRRKKKKKKNLLPLFYLDFCAAVPESGGTQFMCDKKRAL